MKPTKRVVERASSGLGRSSKTVFAWIAGVGFLAGSLAVGISGLSSASPGTSTVVANQGSPGSSPWPVSASGTVGVSNFPATQNVSGTVGIDSTKNGVSINNLPATQVVSGTVGIDPAKNGVSVNNLPATQNVAGSVSITGAPTVTSGDKTTELYSNSTEAIPSTVTTVVPTTDVSAFREVTLYINNVNGPSACSTLYVTNAGLGYTIDNFTLGAATDPVYVKNYDLAPPKIKVVCFNTGSTNDPIFATLTGRAN